MATLTKNLFWGQGERDHRLAVIEGAWPTDVVGSVYVVGPNAISPGGHWFGSHGIVLKLDLVPSASGHLSVTLRSVQTRVKRLRDRVPMLFRKFQFIEFSPMGVTNMANTNVQSLNGRMFLGYDAGRPIEIDPQSLKVISPVGSNGEWLQNSPGLLEPLCAVAAHPASDVAEGVMYFVNYSQVELPGVSAETYVARWDCEGSVQRWRVRGMSAFDSIHDIKTTRHHLVFTDLPFKVEPGLFQGKPREERNQSHTNLWIVPKEALRSTPEMGEVEAVEVQIPMPTGHVYADYEEVDGKLRVILQQIPLGDLMITMTRDSVDHRNSALIDPNYEGLIALALQPSVLGVYTIDPVSGEVEQSDLIMDSARVWGGVLPATDMFSEAGRASQTQAWYGGVGFDPDLVPQQWWDLYQGATDGIVAPDELPSTAVPGTLARFDLENLKVAEVFEYTNGSFPSPPTFVPRVGSTEANDGYVVVIVHQDGPKEIQIFDAANVGVGPVARATSADFNPNLMLHSWWMDPATAPKKVNYKVSVWADLRGALAGLPGVIASYFKMGRAMAGELKASRR